MEGWSTDPINSRVRRTSLLLICLATLASGANLLADGCFVMPPFVWSTFTDVNEPTQKAILLHDAGTEDMILQVRYEGPVAQFGWLIPVPSRPEISVASMASFYELSRFTQEYIYRHLQWGPAWAGGAQERLNSPPPVNVIEYRTVGAYDVAVLATESTDSLATWLLENHFAFRKGSPTALRSYLEKHWFIVALRVHLDQSGGELRVGGSPDLLEQQNVRRHALTSLRIGELHPIKISFDTPDCIFPLKVSSANGKASEVLLYVLSAEPLTRPGLIKPRHHPESGSGYDLPAELEDSFPAGVVEADRLPKCRADLPRLSHRKWTFLKVQRLLRPEEMEDLTFESMFPLIRSSLEGRNSYRARMRLGYLEELGEPLWPELARSSDVENRVTCCTILHAHPRPGATEILLKLLDDSDVSVRFQATAAAESYHDSRIVTKLLGLLSDPDYGAIRRTAALSCGKLGVRDPRVIAALIGLLDDEYRTPREEAQAALIKITGQKYKSTQEWREWWGKNEIGFTGKQAG